MLDPGQEVTGMLGEIIARGIVSALATGVALGILYVVANVVI